MNMLTDDLGTAFDEPRVRALLGGDDDQVTLALALIDRHLRHTMDLWMRRHMRMRAQDRADVWSDTLFRVLRAARRRRFDSTRPVLPWLLRIIRNCAIEHLHRREAWQRFLQGRRLPSLTSLAYPHEGELLAQAADLRALIDTFVSTLPPRQRIAVAVLLEHWPQSRSLKVLQHKVSEKTGRAITPGAVREAMKVGRDKLRHFLRRWGAHTP